MNIGIDVDGVILDTENWFRSMSHIFDCQIGGNGVVDPTKVKVQDRMQWSKENFSKFVDLYMFDCMTNAPIMPGCQYVINELRNSGHKLFLITARGSIAPKEMDLAKATIEKYGLKFDGVYLNSLNKLPVCQNEKIDYMIDDSSDNVRLLSENGIKCLYFRDYGSQDVSNDNVIDVANWGEVYRFLLNKNA